MTPAAHRDQLVSLLAEAAEIEHCLMCTYLYAAFSLKQGADEGLTPDELAAVKRWRAEVIAIAVEEMLHLSLVNNLLIAVGARPHYRRFNFPIGPGLFPADVAVALAPFDAATLDHFIYLERPRSAAERDAARYEKGSYRRGMPEGRLTDANDDYATVGELYETIEASFATLAERLGESALMVGPRSAQLSSKDFRLPGLCTIASVADAREAIHLIVHQGEGSSVENARSHFARFVAIRDEWRALSAQREGFVPARAAAYNPVMRAPVVAGDRVQVLAEPAALLLDAGNVCYVMMLRLLALMCDEAQCRLGRKQVIEQTMTLMHALSDIGSHLTSLPAHPDRPGVHAGMTFTVSRTALGYQSPESAAAVIGERFDALAQRLTALSPHLPGLDRLAKKLAVYARDWTGASMAAGAPVSAVFSAQEAVVLPVHPETPVSAPAGTASGPEASDAHVEVAVGKDVTLRFDTDKCIHSRHCVLGEPQVFLANTPGRWIFPDRATPERLAQVAHNCPSGAITYMRHDGGAEEQAPLVNVARIRENGPYAVHAAMQLTAPDGSVSPLFRATLCRCGQSQRKPFCDSSHVKAAFVASGEPATRPSEPLAVRDGDLEVTPLLNGPLEINGALEICAGTGRTVDRVTGARLCRCGQSQDKPFCDGSHRLAGFEAPGVA